MLAAFTSAFILATIVEPWLLVWVVGLPVLLVATVGAVQLRGWFRARLISIPSEK